MPWQRRILRAVTVYDPAMLRVIVAGATGWVGKPLVAEIAKTSDLQLVGAVARSSAGGRIGDVTISGSVAEALRTPADVFVDYTSSAAVKANVLAAIQAGLHVVVGSSGLSDADFRLIDAEARARKVGVLAVGNFAIAAVLLQKFAVEAARHFPDWEIIDTAYAGKIDAPSGMSRELAWRMSEVATPHPEFAIGDTVGSPEARGAQVAGSRVHSLRLPGHTIGLEVRFGRPDERLTLHYDGGSGSAPYIEGTLLAIRRVSALTGVVRGLDRVLDGA
jgi:4-hydroxy-tetrahydrodipicolinate reductase